ncbi:MAG: DUF3570 domain-containing protein [SAR324 cluster bacterium]|nr:DUF3570 domain-containing protein [SAR324 cluster bacterium]
MQLKTLAKTASIAGAVALSSNMVQAQEQPDAIEGHYFQWKQSGGDGLQTFNKTEDLAIAEPVGVVNLNFGKRWNLNLKSDVDAISAASGRADEIDAASGASGNDTRYQNNVSITYVPTLDLSKDRIFLSGGVSQSREYGYKSSGVNLGVTQEFLDRNFVLGASLTILDDTLRTYRITREAVSGSTGKRTQNLSISGTQLLTRKSLINATIQLTKQEGYLARSLNSVALQNGIRQQERLPDVKDRLALRVQYNQFFGSQSAYHLIYRYYQDSFEVQAHTFQGRIFHELPFDLEIGGQLRYHTQTGVKYWEEVFNGDEQYVTSDSDLEQLASLYKSINFTWKPVLPMPPPLSSIGESDLRINLFLGQYDRTNGLQGTTGGLSIIAVF